MVNCEPRLSTSHLVVLPTYNSGPRLLETVQAALAAWRPVWVVVDGSTDGSDRALDALDRSTLGPADFRLLHRPVNGGKGAAVLAAMETADREGFSHMLVMDAEGQHPTDRIADFMELSRRDAASMILGEPVFGPDAPAERVKGRRVGNWWANLETLWGGIHDSLFGFRVYPIRESLHILHRIRGGRRYDFDTQLAVRLYWQGIRPVNVPVPVRYFLARDGGVSHFRYLRDNLLLLAVHTWLVLNMVPRLPRLLRFRSRR